MDAKDAMTGKAVSEKAGTVKAAYGRAMDMELDGQEAEIEPDAEANKKAAGEEETKTTAEPEKKTDADGETKPDAGAETKTAGEEEKKTDAEPEKKTDADGDRGKLTPEAQAAFDKRIGKEVARRKDLEEDLAAERRFSLELKEKLAAAESKTRETAGSTELLAVESESEIDAAEDRLMDMEAWCEKHRAGYEGEKDEPSFTAAEVVERLSQIRRELRGIPRARRALFDREAFEPTVREAYPALFERHSEEAAELESLARRIPGLRAAKDWKLLVGDMLAGRKLREGKATAKPVEKPAEKKVPAAPSASVPAPVGRKAEKIKGSTAFADGDFTDEALAASFRRA